MSAGLEYFTSAVREIIAFISIIGAPLRAPKPLNTIEYCDVPRSFSERALMIPRGASPSERCTPDRRSSSSGKVGHLWRNQAGRKRETGGERFWAHFPAGPPSFL